MARENQGLQITLIVFVMFTVVFGALTWFFYAKSAELQKKADDQKKDVDTANGKAGDAIKASELMAKLIFGPSATGDADVAKKQAEKAMQDFGGGMKADDLYYHPLVVKLSSIKAARESDLKKKIEEVAAWDVKYREREKSKDLQIAEFKKRAETAEKELAAARANFDKRRAETEALAADLSTQLAGLRKDSAAELEKLKTTAKNIEESLVRTKTSLSKATTELNNSKRTIVDIPDGEIRWVNQRTGLVWINVGREDGLQPLMTFSVFPADVSDLSKGSRKGSIEVTQILDGHMAEARITNDSITDPLMPGDKIDTALWNPGEQLHFALSGLMDVNGDSQNDLELVKNLITMNNGIVDCYEDEKGAVHALDDMSINTRFLVNGSEGKKDASIATMAEGISTMTKRATELGVQTITLQTLLQRMGYKAPVSTKPTGDDDGSRTQTKGQSRDPRNRSADQFQPRQPQADTISTP